jgi:Phytanoyl-CoA dioxygenase (PhyH)
MSPMPRSPRMVRMIRSMPHVYSLLCRSRLLYSRRVLGAEDVRLYREHRDLLAMTPGETHHCAQLARDGYTVIDDVFPVSVIDRILEQADELFRRGHFTDTAVYAGTDLRGRSYDEVASTQKIISLADPLLLMPDCIPLGFHESILRIAANFLGYIPPICQPLVVRDFPLDRPRESSHYHKDNDQWDSLQVFIYLVDIGEHVGAQFYVPGSHRHDPKSCQPRLSRDLGLDGYDGRLSDEEVAKHYPSHTWAVLRPSRGSLGFISGNGIHKGPVWDDYRSPKNQARTAVRIDMHGRRHARVTAAGRKITVASYESMSSLQRLFTRAYRVV